MVYLGVHRVVYREATYPGVQEEAYREVYQAIHHLMHLGIYHPREAYAGYVPSCVYTTMGDMLGMYHPVYTTRVYAE